MIVKVQNRASKETPVCCFKGNNPGNNEFNIEKMINGFARIIVHSDSQGIERYMEGRFDKGTQYDFGRIIITVPTGEEKNYIEQQMSYTGWWPTSY